MSATTYDALSQWERDVMAQLVQTRTTSVVLLAAGLWRTTPDWAAQDPYPALAFVLDELSSRGLVTYRARSVEFGNLPTNIRLTSDGWALMGYPHRVIEVGTPSTHSAEVVHTGDMTNYRNHAFSARGGPIEVDDFPTHRAFYPHHIHDYGGQLMHARQLARPELLADPNGTGDNRGYIKVTPEMEGTVLGIHERQPMLSYKDIAERAQLPERTVRYIITDLPRLRATKAGDEAATSLKERVFNVIKDAHPDAVTNVRELRDVLGMADTEHSVMHVLHSLHTQGRIDFDERGNGMGTATVVNIRLHKKGSNRKPKPTEESMPVITLGEEVPRIQPEMLERLAPTPAEDEGYPLLDELLDRERNRLDADNKAMRYMEAAEVLKDIDPESYASLMERAEKNNVPYPSPIEREYLRYVAANPGANEVKP